MIAFSVYFRQSLTGSLEVVWINAVDERAAVVVLLEKYRTATAIMMIQRQRNDS